MIDIHNLMAAAIEYVPMVDIPFLNNSVSLSNGSSPEAMFNSLFILAIQIGAMLAVFMFVWGGLLMITARDNPTNVTKGKERMQNAVFGLLILLSIFVVLDTINPQLTSLSLFENMRQLSSPEKQNVSPMVGVESTEVPPVCYKDSSFGQDKWQCYDNNFNCQTYYANNGGVGDEPCERLRNSIPKEGLSQYVWHEPQKYQAFNTETEKVQTFANQLLCEQADNVSNCRPVVD